LASSNLRVDSLLPTYKPPLKKTRQDLGGRKDSAFLKDTVDRINETTERIKSIVWELVRAFMLFPVRPASIPEIQLIAAVSPLSW
jgi:hypothetical protein